MFSLILLLSALGIAPPFGLRTATAEPPFAAETPQIVVKKALTVLERGAKEYPEHRQCFACHHQTLPLLAHREAERLKIERKPEFEASTLEFVDASFRGKIADLNAGEGIGGKGLTVGYGLWTFRLGNHPADDLTRAMVAYLLKTQAEDGHWGLHSIRPPSEESVAFATVLAAAGIAHFADESQHADRDLAVEKARNWLRTAVRPLHKDRVARAWGWKLLGGSEEERDAARNALFESQQPDGGWRQTDELPSDAYASGTALYALMETGVTSDHPAVRRGVAFLSRTQKPDGSWHVVTRAKPVQVFFDNGDPHGKDQFISLMATGWAAAAIARGAAADPTP
ncbi:MAG: terpene cyclase/mutase family protein [Planctomycetota bacterium]|nr:terpene cyclase/mutase family protein [Planctomycetota bacterium]